MSSANFAPAFRAVECDLQKKRFHVFLCIYFFIFVATPPKLLSPKSLCLGTRALPPATPLHMRFEEQGPGKNKN